MRILSPSHPPVQQKLKELQSKLGIHFENEQYLAEALTHRSYSNEERLDWDNERLEFLGDSVLGICCAQYLFHSFPDLPEGQLAHLKSKMVSARALAAIHNQYHLTDYLFLGKGESKSGKANLNIQADLVEAILGALYLDKGLKVVYEFLVPFFQKSSQTNQIQGKLRDHKTLLQEYCQKKYQAIPQYKILKEEGSDHDKVFTILVFFQNLFQEQGTGKNKKSAEQDAAKLALEKLGVRG